MQKITSENVGTVLQTSANPTVIYFGATWCGPCRVMKPNVEELEKVFNDKVNFFQVAVDTESSLCSQFGVRGVPTTIFFKQSHVQPNFIMVGLKTKEEIQKQINLILK